MAGIVISEPERRRRRLADVDTMNGQASHLVVRAVNVDRTLEQEFESRLVESSTLAFRVAYAVLRHRQDAEDVAQEAFVKAYQNFARLRERERFRAWLVRITWRLALDRRRGERRRTAREETHDVAAAPPGIDADLVARERAELLWQAIDALPEKLRVTLILASIEGHDVDEVERLLGLPSGTVKSRLFLARRKLKESLQWMQSRATR
jgi:RNA polymerase sigma-70 factor, ECF subfamily